MKLSGKKLVKPNVEIIIIPRGDGDDIVLKAGPAADMETFDKICPAPKPPTRIYPGGRKAEDINDENFQKEQAQHAETRFYYMALKSLSINPELEWETVDLDRPATWKNFLDELKEAGFSEVEVNRVVQGVMDANCLNEDRIDEARQRFLASQQEALEAQSTPADAPSSTQSGESANA